MIDETFGPALKAQTEAVTTLAMRVAEATRERDERRGAYHSADCRLSNYKNDLDKANAELVKLLDQLK